MMVKPPQFLILIYGSSPRLQRAERSLRAATDLRVIQIEPDDDHAMQQLAVVQEGMLLYDVGAVNPQVIQAIHTLHPAMATLGLGGADGGDAFIRPQSEAEEIAAALLALLRGGNLCPPQATSDRC